jgi:hypothetical protein
MKITLGFVKYVGQLVVQELDLITHEMTQKLIDITELPETHLQALIIGQEDHFTELHSLLVKEKSLYPILDAKDFKISLLEFENLNSVKCRELFEKIQHRWLVFQNMNAVEHLIPTYNHLSPLWMNDRITFFEELWHWLNLNLGTVQLSLYFNDIEQIEEHEKNARPKLTQSVLSGGKKAHFKQANTAESEIFNQFTSKHHSSFEVIEFDSLKGRFVAVTQVAQSPILMMAEMNNFNQLQRSLLNGLFASLTTLTKKL